MLTGPSVFLMVVPSSSAPASVVFDSSKCLGLLTAWQASLTREPMLQQVEGPLGTAFDHVPKNQHAGNGYLKMTDQAPVQRLNQVIP